MGWALDNDFYKIYIMLYYDKNSQYNYIQLNELQLNENTGK